jgi:hypothetical protein
MEGVLAVTGYEVARVGHPAEDAAGAPGCSNPQAGLAGSRSEQKSLPGS